MRTVSCGRIFRHFLSSTKAIFPASTGTGGVSRDWQPYVSEGYRRIAVPQTNLVAVAVPIRGGDAPASPVIGILVLQVRVEMIGAWLTEHLASPAESAYIVDHHDRIVFHTGRDPQADIVEVSDAGLRALLDAEESSTAIVPDPIIGKRMLAGYAAVPPFGWRVVVDQDLRSALAERQQELGGISAWLGALLALFLFSAGLLLAFSLRLSAKHAELARLHARHDEELERRVAERTRQLSESERRFATLVDNVPGMVYRCANDRNWTATYLSRGTSALTGYAPDDLVGSRPMNYNALIVPEDRERVWKTVQEAIKRRRPFTIAYRIKTRDGTIKEVWEQGVGVWGGDGSLEALEGIVMDVTKERTEAREQERVSKLLVGRELRMIELKKELDQLRKRAPRQKKTP